MIAIRALLRRLMLRNIPIAYKLALVFTLLSVGSMATFGLIILHNQNQLLEQQSSDFGSTLTLQIAKTALDPLLASDTLSLRVITNNLISDQKIKGAAIYSDDRVLLSSAGLIPDVNGMTATMFTQPYEWRERRAGESLSNFIRPVIYDDVTVGYALISYNRTRLEQTYQHTLQAIIAASIGLALLGILVSVVMGRLMSRPIYHLINVSNKITAGNYQTSFSLKREDEFGALMLALDTMRERLLRKSHVEQTFSHHVSPKVAKALLSNPTKGQLGGRHVEASVLFADIVGFTSLSEMMVPGEINGLLNEYFSYIAKAAQFCNGHVDKFMGDCAMLVFGVPEPDENHDWNAVRCAILIQKLVKEYNLRRNNEGLATVQFRIGVNSGLMLAGNMGAPERFNYTVVGDAVNLASRLSSVAGPDQIMITDHLNQTLQDKRLLHSRPHGTLHLRGKREAVTTCEVLDVTAGHQATLLLQMREIFDSQEIQCILPAS